MNKLFNNILVPIDFSPASNLAIEKAIDIANHFKCNIHLLLAENSSTGIQPGSVSSRHPGFPPDTETKLYQLQNKYTYQLHPGLIMQACMRKGNKNKSVVQYAMVHQIDLVVLGTPAGIFQNLFAKRYSVGEISRRIDCPVLTVRNDPPSDRWRNIVLPVSGVLPIRKIMFASYMARKYDSKIHLLSIAGDETENDGNGSERNRYLSKTYQLLRDNTNLIIECHTVRGHNIAETTLRFAQKINADLIVVNPGRESRLSGFINKVFDGSLFSESRIPVMTISAL